MTVLRAGVARMSGLKALCVGISTRNAGVGLIRNYHARDHANDDIIIDGSRVENQILTKSLEYIPQYGFDKQCVMQAVRDLKYPDTMMSVVGASSQGNSTELQMMVHWLKTQRANLQKEVRNHQSPLHKITNEYDRAAFLINKRLEYNIPILDRLLAGIAQLMVPYNMPYSAEELYNLGDDVAFYAGDLSNDLAWYAKRFSISSVYVSSELFMLQDKSPGFVDTKVFVEDKVGQIDQLGSAYENVEQWAVFNGIGMFNLIKSQLARG